MNGFADRGLDEGDFAPAGVSISSFDAFPKTKQTYLTKSRNGGIGTVVVAALCIWLTGTELWRWQAGITTHTFSVEKGVAHDMQINLDIIVGMQCQDLNINVQDASGDRVLAGEMLKRDPTRWSLWSGGMVVDKKTGNKRRKGERRGRAWELDQLEQYKKVEDVHQYLRQARALRRWSSTPRLNGEPDACRIYGSVEGTKVQGEFHITARGHGYTEWGAQHLDHKVFNFSHRINELSFGPYFPSISQPLDDTVTTTDHHFYKYQYFLSVVPTIYTDKPQQLYSSTHPLTAARKEALRRRLVDNPDQGHIRDQNVMAPSEPDHESHKIGGAGTYTPFTSPHTIYTNQYAVTEQSRVVNENYVPGMFFKYDIEPVLLTVAEEWGGLLGLLVRCVNVIAGVSVAGGWLVSLFDLAGALRKKKDTDGLLHGSEKYS